MNTENHTVRRRFFVSFAGNIFRSGISFVTSILIARTMGPVDYGRMAFLLASFVALRQLLDMATSSAFFTFLSQKTRSKRFIIFYWQWVLFQLLLSGILIALVLPAWIVDFVWKDESRILVLLAFLASFVQGSIWTSALQMGEAQRHTVRVQYLTNVIFFVHLIIVLALIFLDKLAIPLVFIAMIFEWGIASWVISSVYEVSAESLNDEKESQDSPKSILKEFWVYCSPLIPYAWLSVFHDFADRWMLQHWGGAKEQAYYSVAQQLSTIALLATSSILSIFWKEIAEAYKQGNYVQMERFYTKVSRILFFVATCTAGLFLPWSNEILHTMLGASYSNGVFALMVMFLYPIHQSLGQVGGTMLYATSNTKLRLKLGLWFAPSSLIIAYFILAPPDAFIGGFGLASEGLAIKMVLVQFIQVNILCWYIAKLFRWRFDFFYQIVTLVLLISIGFGVNWIISTILNSSISLIIQLGAAFALYSLSVGILIYFFPYILGITKAELIQMKESGLIKLKKLLRE